MTLLHRYYLTATLITLACIAATLLLPPSAWRLCFALPLICLWPGLAGVEAIFARQPKRPPWLTRLVLGCGLSYVITVVGGLWLYYAFDYLTLTRLLTLYGGVTLLGFGLAAFWDSGFGIRGLGFGIQDSGLRLGMGDMRVWLLVLILVFAGYFRFYNLAYSDYRGDEAEVILRAIATERGEGQPILSHTKGPAETLTAVATGLLYGAYEHGPTRAPFAFGNWLAIIALYLLAHALFGPRIALIAAALAAINGWYVTYGRTAQYQNIVLPMLTLGMWGYVRFAQTRAYSFLLLGTLFMGVATFGHYEGAAAGPAALYLLWLAFQKDTIHPPLPTWRIRLITALKKHALPVGVILLLGGIVVLSFYAPFLLSPTVAEAQGHVAKRFGDVPPYNNWDAFYINGLFYNTTYYIWALAAILGGGISWGITRIVGGGKRGLGAVLIALPLLALSWTGILSPWYAIFSYLAIMALFLLSPRVSPPVKALLLWILLPAGLYLFAVIRPGNHYYVYMPAIILLVSLTIDRAVSWLQRRPASLSYYALPALVGGLLLIYGLSAWYQQIVFMRSDLEYMLTWPRHQQGIFLNDARFPFKIRIGWGFPYRLGWQTIAELYLNGTLDGDWYSTDENNSLTWYTLGEPQNPCYPRYFMLTKIGYADPPLGVPGDIIDAHYTLRTQVMVNDEQRLILYEFTPNGVGSDQPLTIYHEPTPYPTHYTSDLFKGDPLRGPRILPQTPFNPPQRFKPHPNMLAELSEVYDDPNTTLFQDEVALLGYDLDLTWAEPGGVVLLTLYWRAESAVILPYKVFTHLEDDRLWAQADDEPACAHRPTYTWRTGDHIMDRHAIFLPPDMPPGSYPLQVGLYEIRSSLRMDVLDEAGNPAGNGLLLEEVVIGE